jgi:hypothetical protein
MVPGFLDVLVISFGESYLNYSLKRKILVTPTTLPQ